VIWEKLYRPDIYKRKYTGDGTSEASLASMIDEYLSKESKKDDWNLFISKCF